MNGTTLIYPSERLRVFENRKKRSLNSYDHAPILYTTAIIQNYHNLTSAVHYPITSFGNRFSPIKSLVK